jgi:hypothetical protein
MMRKVLVLLVAIGALAVLVQPVAASVTLGDKLYIDSTTGGCVRGNSGGEFYVKDTTNPATFLTFCGDDSHYFSPGGTYTVTDFVGVSTGLIPYTNVTAWNLYLNTLPIQTGPPTTPATASSLQQAAWLFDQYSNNSSTTIPSSGPWVPGHAFLASGTPIAGYGSSYIAAAIQDAIWSLEGYSGDWSGADQTIARALGWLSPSGTFSSLNFDGIGTLAPENGTVFLIELSGNYSPAQGQLYQIPEPATILVWSLLGAVAWLGMRVVRRRR